MLSARLTAAGRRAIPWLTGAAALMMRDRSLELTAPSPCPGLLELASIAALRLNPGLAVGTIFGALHTASFVAAIAAFVALVERSTRNAAVAASAGLAVALSPLFGSTLSPPWEPAAFGVCAALVLLLPPPGAPGSGSTRARVVLLTGGLLIAALIVPPWLAVAASGAAVIAAIGWPRRRPRGLAGAAAGAAVLLLAPAMLNLSRPGVLAGAAPFRGLMSCTLPTPSIRPALAAVAALGWWLGPFALGLALLGAVAHARRADMVRPAFLIAAASAGAVMAAGAGLSTAVSIAPLAVALWWLAALGLQTLIAAIGRGPVRAMVAIGILLLLPALEASRRVTEPRDDRVRPQGHESQTLRQTIARLDLVAQNATFVQEDATVDALLRAAVFGGRRRGKPVVTVPADAEAVARALANRTVYAFPWRQAELSLRGFVVEPLTAERGAPAALEGLATVPATRRCASVGAPWTALPASSGRIGVTADAPTTVGPLLLFYGGHAASAPVPDGWPPRTLRGYRFAVFDQRAAVQPRLQAEARDNGLAEAHPVLAAPFVIRLALHRTPGAPLGFAVALGAPFPVGVGKMERGESAAGQFIVCDAPAIGVSPLPPRD